MLIKFGTNSVANRFSEQYGIAVGKHDLKNKMIWVHDSHFMTLPKIFEDHLIVFYPFS